MGKWVRACVHACVAFVLRACLFDRVFWVPKPLPSSYRFDRRTVWMDGWWTDALSCTNESSLLGIQPRLSGHRRTDAVRTRKVKWTETLAEGVIPRAYIEKLRKLLVVETNILFVVCGPPPPHPFHPSLPVLSRAVPCCPIPSRPVLSHPRSSLVHCRSPPE